MYFMTTDQIMRPDTIHEVKPDMFQLGGILVHIEYDGVRYRVHWTGEDGRCGVGFPKTSYLQARKEAKAAFRSLQRR